MLAVYGPHSQFWHEAKKQFFDQIWCFFTIKTRLWQYYSHLNDEFLVLLGPIISRFLHVQMRKKINQNNKGCVLWSYLYGLNRLQLAWLSSLVQWNSLACWTHSYVTNKIKSFEYLGPMLKSFFTARIHYFLEYARVFAPGNPFQLSKPRAYLLLTLD